MEDVYTFVVAIVLLVLLVADWIATTILFRASRQAGDNPALTERARMAGFLAIASTINGVLAVNRLLELHLLGFAALVLITISLILGSIPNMYWLSLYVRNKLHK